MCSVGDDNLDGDNNKFMSEKSHFILNEKQCNKCRQADPKVVLRHKDAYCKNCFLAGTVHKFKAFLGKHRFVYPNDKVLVLYKGGHPTTALLSFLRSGLDLSTPKRLRFEPIILYIEDRYDLTLAQRLQALQDVHNEVKRFNFRIYFVSLLDYLRTKRILKSKDLASSDNIENSSMIQNQADCDQSNLEILHNDYKLNIKDDDYLEYKKFFSEKVNLTSKNDSKTIDERNLLIQVAEKVGCKCVFTTDLSIDLAAQLLTNVSLGRGSHLALDIGICDDRDPAVKIIRPLRMFEMKELAFYNIFNGLHPVIIPEKRSNPFGSVQTLMKKFVEDLQANYPATITTVVRTGDKLAMDKSASENTKCKLCKGPVESETQGISSAESTNFSHWVSTQTADNDTSPIERYNRTLEGFVASKRSDYCFGCSKIADFIL